MLVPSKVPSLPFIPVLNASFEVWFKKAAEDIKAVFDHCRTQRVCILQGSMAVKQSNVKDEPIKDLPGNINSELLQRLLELKYSGDESKVTVPTVDYLIGYAGSRNTSPASMESFFEEYPITSKQLLASEDSAYFLATSQCPSQKPVPFIPVLDASFEVWFQKDSLWAAENIEAVFDQDPQRVCILQGPMAVKQSKVQDEPIKDLLGNINSELIQRLLELKYSGDESKVPTVDYLSAKLGARANIKRPEANGDSFFEFGSTLPEVSAWLNTLAGPDFSWLRALVVVAHDGDLPVLVSVYGAARSYGEHKPMFQTVYFKFALKLSDLSILEDRQDVSVPLSLQFEYKPSPGFAPIHEIVTGHNTRIKENTFETLEEPDYVVKLETEAAVGILQSDESEPLLAGTSLIFRVASSLQGQDFVSQCFGHRQHLQLVLVGSVDLHQDNCRGNPVVAYIQRHGSPPGLATPLANDSYTLSSGQSLLKLPSLTSRIPRFLAISTRITSTLTSRITLHFPGRAPRPVATLKPMLPKVIGTTYLRTTFPSSEWCFPATSFMYDVSFVGMVLPSDELHVKNRHIGMRDDNIVVNVVTSNSRGEKVLEGSAEISQPTTVYVFTGQGSQEGMGMDLYNSSPAAHAIWDGADAHLLAVL
ncbi:hypothetical protein GGX14DRAFT_671257 [Mycena pura]|uniref:Uncharacterized protein n=1 Tax=Mycena pura TaxID=153505 RepID=A0AAD6VT56_9AGAR|nr:hypothetical protein GGX14DRAFT_671257 [Mycena pura]